MMVDDCLHDPVLGAEVLLGYKIPPHEALRIRGMWLSRFMIDSSGSGTGKSFNIAIVAALRTLLIEDRMSGIISKTFPQGKLVYANFDRWIETSPIFRNEIRKNRVGEPMSSHGTDVWQLTARNGSVVRVIPPGFMNDAERAASESWTDGYYDEWTRYHNYEALDRLLIPRVRKPIPECYDAENPVFGHHVYLGGTAAYQWNPAYQKVVHFIDQIALGSRRYEVQAWNYTHYPERFKRLLNPDMIDYMRASLRPDQFQMEVMGRWVRDSVGYYSARDVAALRESGCPVITEN